MIRLDSIVHTPLESVFCATQPLPEFHFQFKFKRTGPLDTNLLIGGEVLGWPLFHVSTCPTGIHFGTTKDGVWCDSYLDYPDAVHEVSGDYFGAKFTLCVDGQPALEDTPLWPGVTTWGIGASPMMLGNALYGHAEIWRVRVYNRRLEAAETVRGMHNIGYDYEAVSRLDPVLSAFSSPCVIRVDVDRLGSLNLEHGWEHSDVILDQILIDLQAVISELGASARTHYQKRWNDEMVVLCEAADAAKLAAAFRDKLHSTSYRELPAGRVTASFGIGTEAVGFFALYANAGIALRAAKAAGRDCTRSCP